MTVVEQIYKDLKDAAGVLAAANEISLQIMLESNLRKTLLLSAASYFENLLTREVTDFVAEITAGNLLIVALVRSKAVSRQYHTWFDWEKENANKFFGLFGEGFRQHMASKISKNDDIAEGIKAFIEIGRERNLLVHSDYASYLINKTPEEIFELYKKANKFAVCIGSELRDCSFEKKL